MPKSKKSKKSKKGSRVKVDRMQVDRKKTDRMDVDRKKGKARGARVKVRQGTGLIQGGRAREEKDRNAPMVPFLNSGVIAPPPLMQVPSGYIRMSQAGIPAQQTFSNDRMAVETWRDPEFTEASKWAKALEFMFGKTQKKIENSTIQLGDLQLGQASSSSNTVMGDVLEDGDSKQAILPTVIDTTKKRLDKGKDTRLDSMSEVDLKQEELPPEIRKKLDLIEEEEAYQDFTRKRT